MLPWRLLATRQTLEKVLPACYIAGLLWIHVYICRRVFFLEYTGQMHSMHGFWMAMARLAGDAWVKPAWWPYWFGGMPFTFTYMPGVPGLAAAISRLAGISAAQAFNVVCGLVYCFGPVALFVLAWRVTRQPGWSFIAALVYSLTSPTELIYPDDRFKLVHALAARRFYLCFVWDEVPHQLALAFVSLALLFFARGFHDRRGQTFLWAGVFTAAALLSNPFGLTALALSLVCLLVTCATGNWKRNLLAAALCGIGAYLAVCPFLPPSLLQAMHADANLFPDSAFTAASLRSLAGVVAVGAVLWWISRNWRWHLRFFLLLTYSFTAIVFLQRWNLHFIPQPGRYKVEMELALALFLVFTAARWLDRAPVLLRIALALCCILPAVRQVTEHRRFARRVLNPIDITSTIEYQVARWTGANLPGQRVNAPGSIAQWMNVFSETPQLAGGSYTMAPTAIGQVAVWGILAADDQSAGLTSLWMKAFGVDAVIVSGKDSPEFWKPFQGKHQFEGILPVLWSERDTTVYALPRRNRSLAWVIPQTAVVRTAPRGFTDTQQIRRYVAALDDAALPAAEFRWRDRNHASVRAAVAAPNVVSVQETYHPGWRAAAGGSPVPIARDGLGQMILRPMCAGACEIEMAFDGGGEAKVTRALCLVTLLAVAGWALWLHRARRRPAVR